MGLSPAMRSRAISAYSGLISMNEWHHGPDGQRLIPYSAAASEHLESKHTSPGFHVTHCIRRWAASRFVFTDFLRLGKNPFPYNALDLESPPLVCSFPSNFMDWLPYDSSVVSVILTHCAPHSAQTPCSDVPGLRHRSTRSGGNVAKWVPGNLLVGIVHTLRKLAPPSKVWELVRGPSTAIALASSLLRLFSYFVERNDKTPHMNNQYRRAHLFVLLPNHKSNWPPW